MLLCCAAVAILCCCVRHLQRHLLIDAVAILCYTMLAATVWCYAMLCAATGVILPPSSLSRPLPPSGMVLCCYAVRLLLFYTTVCRVAAATHLQRHRLLDAVLLWLAILCCYVSRQRHTSSDTGYLMLLLFYAILCLLRFAATVWCYAMMLLYDGYCLPESVEGHSDTEALTTSAGGYGRAAAAACRGPSVPPDTRRSQTGSRGQEQEDGQQG